MLAWGLSRTQVSPLLPRQPTTTRLICVVQDIFSKSSTIVSWHSWNFPASHICSDARVCASFDQKLHNACVAMHRCSPQWESAILHPHIQVKSQHNVRWSNNMTRCATLRKIYMGAAGVSTYSPHMVYHDWMDWVMRGGRGEQTSTQAHRQSLDSYRHFPLKRWVNVKMHHHACNFRLQQPGLWVPI